MPYIDVPRRTYSLKLSKTLHCVEPVYVYKEKKSFQNPFKESFHLIMVKYLALCNYSFTEINMIYKQTKYASSSDGKKYNISKFQLCCSY